MFLLYLRRMPELPDVVVYIEALQQRIMGRNLERLRIASPFLLRTTTPRPHRSARQRRTRRAPRRQTHCHRL